MSTVLSVPHRPQLADGYCLPACVQMILAYWGVEREQADLARQLQMVAGAGVPGNRVRLLASRRLDVFYGEGDLADLEAALEAGIPPIALVHTAELPAWEQETAHAVVLVGIEESTLIVNDPGLEAGGVPIPLGDFELAWDEMANLYALLRAVS